MGKTKQKDVKIVTGKFFKTDDGLSFLAVATKDLFGKPDIVLVSKDGDTWVRHDADELMEKVNNNEPIKVA